MNGAKTRGYTPVMSQDHRRRRFAVACLLGALAIVLAGCQSEWLSTPNAPARIQHERTQTTGAQTPVVIAPIVIEPRILRGADGVETYHPGQIVPGIVVPMEGVRTDTVKVTATSPENPAGVTDMSVSAKGDAKASAPASHKQLAPAGPSQADKAVGALVWLGGILFVVGVIGVGLRLASGLTPWLMWAAVIPIGLSVSVALGGLGLIVVMLWLDSAPTWQKGLIVLGAVAVGVVFAFGDNIRAFFAKKQPAPPAEPTPPTEIKA